MSRLHPRRLLAVIALAVAAVGAAHAQAPPPGSSPTATAAPPVGSAPPTASAPPLPPGHPPMAPPGGQDLPPGHPPTGQGPPTGQALPPGHPPAGQAPPSGPEHGFYRPQPDQVLPDAELPAGTVDVQVLDADQRPVPEAPITLAILTNSVLKGESTESVARTANALGRHRFTDLATGAGISYSVSTSRGPAKFSAEPFGLRDKGGIRVVLHAYDPVTRLQDAKIFMQAFVVLEVKQESVAVNHLLDIFNVDRTAFVPEDVAVTLPANFSAFTTDEEMTSAAVDEKGGKVHLVGTFPPGRTQLTYRYQLELGSASEQRVSVPLMPRVVAAQVQSGAGPGMGLEVAGFPEARRSERRDGRRIFATEKQLDPGESHTLGITLRGIPTPGHGRTIALGLALVAAGAGMWFLQRERARSGLSADQREDLVEARDALLGELTELERMHQRGAVGPRTYQRIHTALLDALARILERLDVVAAVSTTADDERPTEPPRKTKQKKHARRPRPARPLRAPDG